MTDEQKNAFDDAAKSMHEATRALQEANETALKRGEETGELKERLEKAETGIREAEDKWRAVDEERKAAEEKVAELERKQAEIEVKLQLADRNRKETPSLSEIEEKEAQYESAYKKILLGAFGFDIKGQRVERPNPKWALTEDEQKAYDWYEEKALSVDGGESGGYMMPPAQRGELIRKLIEFDPLEELANSVTLTQGDTWEAPREGDQNFACDWVGERGTRSATDTAQFALEKIVAHELYAKPLISQKMLDVIGVNIDSWLVERLVRRFRVKRGIAFITGDGSNKPEGITVNATAIGSGSYGYVAMGHASTIDSGDGLWDVAIDLEEPFAQNSTWLWRRATTGIIRKLKDGNENYIWAPAFESIPPSVCDRPYRESISMPAVAANAFSVALGDWESAYTVVRGQDVRTLRDPYSTKPYVEYYTTMSVGGSVTLNQAYRLGKIATS